MVDLSALKDSAPIRFKPTHMAFLSIWARGMKDPVLRRAIPLLLSLAQFSAGAEIAPLTSLAEVRAVPHVEAAKGLPVLVEGTVIYFKNNPAYQDKRDGLVLHDGTAGCYVSSSFEIPFREHADIRPGTRLRVKGFTQGNTYFPDIINAKVEVLGQGRLPKPLGVAYGDLFFPEIDSEWVEVEATVIGLEKTDLRIITLAIDIEGRIFKALVPAAPDSVKRVAALMQRRVRLQGIVGTIRNGDRQLTDRHFFVPSLDHFIPTGSTTPETPPPLRTIANLLQSDHRIDKLVRVIGVVTQVEEAGMYIRDENRSTFVTVAEETRYPPGSEVEVEGYAAVAPFRPILRAARIKLLRTTDIPPATPFEPESGLKTKLHATRVVIECEFLARRNLSHETILQCRAGDRYFDASLPSPDLDEHSLRPGDQVRLTGIYEVTTTQPTPRMQFADGFRLHLPGSAGIEVLRRAPFWTLQRVMMALGVLVLTLLGVFVWNWLLRKRVTRQAKIISDQAAQGIVKDERQRIARELHDTLEQELTGLSMQLGNLSSSIDGENHPAQQGLSLARNMLKHCRSETRSSIVDLRNPDLLERGLPEAMRKALPAALGEAKVSYHFECEGTPREFPVTTGNHLLRIAREAVINAVRHAAPDRIEVRMNYGSENITLTIDDDGSGFDPEAPPPTGHFGLIGIRERSNKILADLTITSSPGSGTNIRVCLPLTSPHAQLVSQS